MNTNIDFNNVLKKLIPFIGIVLFSMLLNTILFFFLPKSYFSKTMSENRTIDYKKYKIREGFEEKKIVKKKLKKHIVKKEYALISNILLNMIYQEENQNGWIVIAEKSSRKTTILGINELYKNYKLLKIFENHVIFEKNNREYKLLLNSEKQKTPYIIEKTGVSIEKIDDQYQLKRDLINEYTQNSSKIWKEISIKETVTNGSINGFKITRIPQKSVFKKLGLRQGDIIKSVNNVKLKSYADAFNIYKKISKVKNMKFVVLRGNQEVELEYEIK